GEGEEEIAQIALGIDHQRGNAVDRGLLEERQAEAGLAAARHAHADRVGDEIFRIVEEQGAGGCFRAEIVGAPEVEHAELFEVGGGGGGGRGRGPGGGGRARRRGRRRRRGGRRLS